MAKKTPPAVDPTVCPVDGATMVANQVPTDEQRAAAENKDNPAPLPPHFDTANAKQRAQLGALYTCPRCGYVTRIPSGPAPAADGDVTT